MIFKDFSEVYSQIRWQNSGVHKKIVFTSKCYFGVFFWSTLWCFVFLAYWRNLFEKRIWKKIFLNFDEQKAKLTKVGSKSAPAPPLSGAPELLLLLQNYLFEKTALSQNLIWKFWLNCGRHFATLQFVLFLVSKN